MRIIDDLLSWLSSGLTVIQPLIFPPEAAGASTGVVASAEEKRRKFLVLDFPETWMFVSPDCEEWFTVCALCSEIWTTVGKCKLECSNVRKCWRGLPWSSDVAAPRLKGVVGCELNSKSGCDSKGVFCADVFQSKHHHYHHCRHHHHHRQHMSVCCRVCSPLRGYWEGAQDCWLGSPSIIIVIIIIGNTIQIIVITIIMTWTSTITITLSTTITISWLLTSTKLYYEQEHKKVQMQNNILRKDIEKGTWFDLESRRWFSKEITCDILDSGLH